MSRIFTPQEIAEELNCCTSQAIISIREAVESFHKAALALYSREYAAALTLHLLLKGAPNWKTSAVEGSALIKTLRADLTPEWRSHFESRFSNNFRDDDLPANPLDEAKKRKGILKLLLTKRKSKTTD